MGISIARVHQHMDADQRVALRYYLQKYVNGRFPVLAVVRVQKSVSKLDQLIRDDAKLLQEVFKYHNRIEAEYSVPRDDRWEYFDDEDFEGILEDYRVNRDSIIFHMFVRIAKGFDPFLYDLVPMVLYSYEKHGLIEDIKAQAKDSFLRTYGNLEGLGFNNRDLAVALTRTDYTDAGIFFRSYIMASYYKKPKDLAFWDFLYTVCELGDAGVSPEGLYRHDIIANRMNEANCFNPDAEPWTSVSVEKFIKKIRETIFKNMHGQSQSTSTSAI